MSIINLPERCSPNRSIEEHKAVRNETIEYRSAVCSLLHTHPELSYSVGQVTKSVQIAHYLALQRIFRYLQGVKNSGLLYKLSNTKGLVMTAFCDSDWAGDVDDRRSTSEYVVTLNINPITFK